MYRFCTSGLTAGTKYTYRVFAMNEASAEAGVTDTNTANTVFSWWRVGSATTSQAEVPGRPLGLVANQSISHVHTEIVLAWNPPTSDHDGGGDGDGYGVIIEYVIEKSDDGGNSWSSLTMVTPAKACKAGGTGATHKGVEGQWILSRFVSTPTRSWPPARPYAIAFAP